MSSTPSLKDFISSDFWASLVDQAFGRNMKTTVDEFQKIKPPENDPYIRDYEEIISIQQKGSRGFKTIDIDPNLLDRETYSPALDQVILNQLVGGESGNYAKAIGMETEATTLPFWRTIGFQLNANFLKVEYLPSPINDSLNPEKIEPNESALPYYQNPQSIPWSAATNSPMLKASGPYDSQSYICVESGVQDLGFGPTSFSIGDVVSQIEPHLDQYKWEVVQQSVPYDPGYTMWNAATNTPLLKYDAPWNSSFMWVSVTGTQNLGFGPTSYTVGNLLRQISPVPDQYKWQKTGTAPLEGEIPNYVPIKWASDRMILINFEDTTSAPLIAKHGDVFKIPFNTVYLTIKRWSPRIRLTVGYNASIESSDQDMSHARSLAFAGGQGFLQNQYIHYVPFSITNENVSNSDPVSALFLNESTMTTKNVPLIINPGEIDGFPYPGVLYGWINGFSVKLAADSVLPVDRVGAFFEVNADICVAQYPSLTVLRRLTQGQVSLTNSDRKDLFQKAIGPEPIRFSLNTGECLLLRLKAYNRLFDTVHAYPFFELDGYCYGNLVGSGLSTNLTPFFPAYLTTQSSFPMDRFTTGAPR